MKNLSYVLFCLLLLSLCDKVSHAEINVVDSLEWMTLDTPLIVRAQATKVSDSKGLGQIVYRDVFLQVQETLKGQVGNKPLRVRLRLFTGNSTGLNWPKNKHSLLFFLRRGRAQDDRALDGCWVVREPFQSIIDLSHPERVYTADMKRATKASAILPIVRDFAKRSVPHRYVGAPNIFKPQEGYVRLEIPTDSPCYAEVFGGSACYINVPAQHKEYPKQSR